MLRTNRTRATSLLLIVALALSACAPTSSAPTVSIGSVPELATFHPQQSGLEWRYLYENDGLDTQPVTVRVIGPTSENGRSLTVTHTFGRGYDMRRYLEYGADGVHLIRERRPGVELSYDPPIQELPNAMEANPGSVWEGTTRVTMRFSNTLTTQTSVIDYRYEIVERRQVQTPAGTFDVLVIDLQSRDENGNRIAQQLWYTPYVGYIKTGDNGVLIATNNQRGGF